MTKKNKIILICAVAFLLAAAVTTTLCLTLLGKNDNGTPATKNTVELDIKSYELEEDETFVLTLTTDSNDIVKWTSSNSSVASVSSQGRVIAKTVGEVVITASVGDASDQCKIVVVPSSSETKVVLEASTVRLTAESSQKIQGKVVTADGEKTLEQAGATYTVEDNSIVAVKSDGTVVPRALGSTVVYVKVAECTQAVSAEVYTMLVSTAEDWNAMLALKGNLNARYYVTNDIDFTGIAYNAKTGNVDKVLLSESFSGSLDGGGHSVKNITFDSAVTEQSLFGTIAGLTLTNISFENVHFTQANAAGLAVRFVQHYDEVDVSGNFTGSNVVVSNIVSNVSCDFVYDQHGACGIATTYYGGGLENVFVNMRMSDGSAMNVSQDYAVARQSMIWYDNNYINNVVVLAENGTVSTAWNTKSDGEGRTLDLSLLFVCNTKMEAGYQVRTLFDNNVWSVTPGKLPALR